MSATVLNASQLTTLQTKRHLEYLEIQNNSGNPTYQVDINSGIVGMDDGTVMVEVSSPITVDITASGANGLDTGSEASSTWYYVYLIYNPSTDTVAGLFSTSASSPTMPSGYTKKRLVGCVRNDSSSDFLKFLQHNERYKYSLYHTVLTGGTATSFTAIDCSSFAPPNLVSAIELVCYTDWNLAGSYEGNAFVGGDGTGYYTAGYFRRNDGTGDRVLSEWDTEVPCFSSATPNMYYYLTNANGRMNIFLHGFVLRL